MAGMRILWARALIFNTSYADKIQPPKRCQTASLKHLKIHRAESLCPQTDSAESAYRRALELSQSILFSVSEWWLPILCFLCSV